MRTTVSEQLCCEGGVFLGSIVGSEITAASTINAAEVGKIRRDPFAILPFCGYNMGDYFQHWIDVGNAAKDKDLLPKIFYVNWFRKDENNDKLPGGFMWPGYGDNSRILAWIFDRCNGVDNAVDTPIGLMPKDGALNTDGLADYYKETLPEILKVDVEGWKKEVKDVRENHYPKFGKHLPKDAYNRKCVKNKAATAGLFSIYLIKWLGARLASDAQRNLDDLEARLNKA